MAKFSIEFDSSDKSLKVMRDGEVLENVMNVEMFKAYMDEDVEEALGPRFHLRIVTQSESEDEVYENMMITASDITKNVFNNEIEEAVAKHYGVL